MRQLVLAALLAAIPASSSAQMVLEAVADATVNTDLNSRADDNYGCDPYLKVGGSRGGGGIPNGGADGSRAFLEFDLSGFTDPVDLAMLELTISGFALGGTPKVHTLDVHRVVESGTRTPVQEGTGDEGPAPLFPGCTSPDAASGVAWIGVEDGGPLNKHSQPDFDPVVAATSFVDEPGGASSGDTVQWDITTLVNSWITGASPNYGLILRDVTTNGTFHHIILTSRNADLFAFTQNRQWPIVAPGPRLKIYQTVSVESRSWGRVKNRYR